MDPMVFSGQISIGEESPLGSHCCEPRLFWLRRLGYEVNKCQWHFTRTGGPCVMVKMEAKVKPVVSVFKDFLKFLERGLHFFSKSWLVLASGNHGKLLILTMALHCMTTTP